MKTITPDPPRSNTDYTHTLLSDHAATRRALAHYEVDPEPLNSRIFVCSGQLIPDTSIGCFHAIARS